MTPSHSLSPTTDATWSLTGQLGASQAARSVMLVGFPFVIGRGGSASLTLSSPTVSTHHAELRLECGRLVISDLGSTNGTFVNGVRLRGEATLNSGDLLQIAEAVFRVGVQHGEPHAKTIPDDLTDQALALIQFDKMIAERSVVAHYQPIVEMATKWVAGFEALGRGGCFGLRTPDAMFSAAAALDLEAELSQLLRQEGVRGACELPANLPVFVNTHPAELRTPDLLEASLRELRSEFPNAPLVLEIHEAAVTSVRQMRELRSLLDYLDIKLAYDDFGAGQARLAEIGDAPPDFLKFDIQLIRGIDLASDERLRMLRGMVRMTSDLGIVSLAEGIETQAEHGVCRKLGFAYGQGYFYGRPAMASTFASAPMRRNCPATIGPTLGDMYS